MADNTMESYAYPRYAYPRYAYPAAYYAVALDYFQMEAHRHDQWEIMYLVTGTCRVEVEGVLVEMEERPSGNSAQAGNQSGRAQCTVKL